MGDYELTAFVPMTPAFWRGAAETLIRWAARDHSD
jgi:hypothetical protein